MLHPSDALHQHHTVRDGRDAPVMCSACGCRLQEGLDGGWFHFGPMAGRDARGCRVACADLAHGEDGVAALPALA